MTLSPARSERGDATASPRSAASPDQEVPVRAEGVQLIGEMPGSGYRTPPKLVRRADGQTIQLTPLLYLVLEGVDGRRTNAEISERVSAAFGRPVSAENVATLVDQKLRPLGVLLKGDGTEPELKKSNPLLGIHHRVSITDPAKTDRLTAPFARLFHPVLVVAITAAFFWLCWWLLLDKGLASATHDAFHQPGLLLAVFMVTVLSAGFHEFGHAAAARRGGSTPGVMGMGLYLFWPAFYTDVTDSYRLGRVGRLRTDLGGLYFNAIVAVGIVGAWWFVRNDALLLVVATQILQMLRQLTPMIRFDGYHVLADLTGVPDLYHHIKPILLGVLPWRWRDPEVTVLKPWARGRRHALGARRRARPGVHPRLDGGGAPSVARHRLGRPGRAVGLARRRLGRRRPARRRSARAGDRRARPADPRHRLRADPAGPPGGRLDLASYRRQAGPARDRRRHRGGDRRRPGLGLVAGRGHVPPGRARRGRHPRRRAAVAADGGAWPPPAPLRRTTVSARAPRAWSAPPGRRTSRCPPRRSPSSRW